MSSEMMRIVREPLVRDSIQRKYLHFGDRLNSCHVTSQISKTQLFKMQAWY